MAEAEHTANGGAPSVKFALCIEEPPPAKSVGGAPVRSTSRFQVAKVQVEDETAGESPTTSPPTTASDELQGGPSDSTCVAADDGPASAAEATDAEGAAGEEGKPTLPAPLGVVFSECLSETDTSASPPNTAGYDGQSFTYDTHNLKTFGHNTLETLPHLDHYRNLLSATGAMRKRPTLLELHEHEKEEEYNLLEGVENGTKLKADGATDEVKAPAPTAIKFGWITGVLVRCLLNIYGVMLFLRLSWVVGQAGIGLSAVVVLLAAVVTTITALSMAAICTNGQVKGGGAYFMISRSLGPEFGGAIGIVFSMANAVAVAMYVVGFAETIRDVLKSHGRLMVDEVNDVRIIGLITVCVVLGVALIGMEWESKAQLGLLAILLVAIANFFIGSFIPPSDDRKAKGFVGYRAEVFTANWGPDFRDGHNFFSVFAIFFPAATGILAGANISGDLADAQAAIPKGTLLAILISMVTYVVMAWMAGAVALRDASGVAAVAVMNYTGLLAPNGTGALTCGGDAAADRCQYGLQNDMQVMQLVSAFGPITIAGIISATLSSALASLVSAPKVFQAVCKDKIFPGIHVFAKGYGKNEEPRRAYILTFVIALACIAIGQLNAIAPLISNFFLMSYALINYSCFDASLAKSPGWRPAFRFYSMWLSLVGALICLGVMFVISWYIALLTLAVVAALYTFVHYRKPDINWGSSTQAHVYRNALQHTLKLTSVLEHIKNFRPQILVLCGFPSERPALVDIASTLTKNISLMICGHIMQGEPADKLYDVGSLSRRAYSWLSERKVKAFYTAVTAVNLRSGAQSLLQCSGMGKLRPNTLLLGFMSRWRSAKRQEVEDYFKVIHDAFDLRCGVGVVRLPEGLQCHNEEMNDIAADDATPFEEVDGGVSGDVEGAVGGREGGAEAGGGAATLGVGTVRWENESYRGDSDNEAATRLRQSPPGGAADDDTDEKAVRFALLSPGRDTFNKKQHGSIDVWWLFDDGGLTLLIPYILSTKSQWQNCKLRVFMAGTKTMELDRNQRHLATMLSKFRIEYSSMTVVQDIGRKVRQKTYDEFKESLGDWRLREDKGETEEEFPWKVTESELSMQKDKTFRHLRLQELLHQYSNDATLIVMTLPMPRKGLVSAGLYMSWLDVLSRDQPPIILLRGNQTSVLTFYS